MEKPTADPAKPRRLILPAKPPNPNADPSEIVVIIGPRDVTIASELVKHLFELPIPFFAQRSSTDLITRVQSNKAIRDALAGQSVTLLANGVMLTVYLALMFATLLGEHLAGVAPLELL